MCACVFGKLSVKSFLLCFLEIGGARGVLIYKTEKVFKNILLFWILCALNEHCIQPIKTLDCNWTKFHRNEYAGNYTMSINSF